MSSNGSWLNLPNRITIARLIIAVLLFVLLSYDLANEHPARRSLILNIACAIFVVCVTTDWLDGYLARRYNMITAFGRIADPFVDKVVVCGTSIYLVGIAPELFPPWLAVVLVGREFLVTGLRSFIEASGIPFGARLGGKLKMILQSIALPFVLCYEANKHAMPDEWKRSAYWICWSMLFLMLLTTLLSAWDSISASISALRKNSAGNKTA